MTCVFAMADIEASGKCRDPIVSFLANFTLEITISDVNLMIFFLNSILNIGIYSDLCVKRST